MWRRCITAAARKEAASTVMYQQAKVMDGPQPRGKFWLPLPTTPFPLFAASMLLSPGVPSGGPGNTGER